MFKEKTSKAASDKPLKKKETSPAPASSPAPSKDMPLFITRPIVVESKRHAKAGIRLDQAMGFASKTNSVPLNITEFAEAAKFYPIVLTGAEPLIPTAIVGLEQKNYFIDEKNTWRENTYIPAYVRKYPFVFAGSPLTDELTLCVDEDAPHFAMSAEDKEVAKLFDEHGSPTKFARNALAFCLAVQQDYNLTRQFCDALLSLNILTANKVDVTLVEGEMLSLGGFQQIDQEKFKQLPDDKIIELHKKGWLPLIHYMFLSNTNWKNLLDMAVKTKH